ncbi:PD-(D/E)XK nuclease family protein, partial [Thermodesulfobacteriota bacterium]
KGLEFPMVILPQLGRKITARQNPGKTVRLYKSETDDPLVWNHSEGEIPLWPVEIPLIAYKKKHSPLGTLLQRRNSLEDIAENRRVFYVGCTRVENHLVLLGQSNRKKDSDIISLTSDDYRERASLFEILDDIYPLNGDSGDNNSLDNNPVIFNMDVEKRKFTGVEYYHNMPDKDSFGVYDENLKKMDLTDPVDSLPYFQFSFSSVRIYKKCPVRFYYHAMLKLRDRQYIEPDDTWEPYERSEIREDENEYSSEDALFIGDLIHKYMEKHDFGEPFDERLFQTVANRIDGRDCNAGYCLEKAEKQLRYAVGDGQLLNILAGVKNHIEIPFLVTISPGVEFRGIADRLFRDKETGQWTIIDWKSNDLEGKDPDTIIRENNYDMQLAFYRWAVEKILGERVGRQIIYFLDKGILKEVNWKGDPLQVIEEIIFKMRKYEENPGEWKKDLSEVRKDDTECRFCEYRNSICMK